MAVRPSDLPVSRRSATSRMSWILWLFLLALLVLPVLLRWRVGDEPDNTITHESGDEAGEEDAGPDASGDRLKANES